MNYKQLKFANDHDEIVVFQDNSDYEYVAIGGVGKDYDGNYKRSDWWDTKQKALHQLGYYGGYSEEQLKEALPNWTFIDSIPPKLATVPVGIKVKILDCAEEECKRLWLDWNDEMKEVVGKVCEIKELIRGDYYIWNEDKSDYELYPRSSFTVVLEEETTKEMEEAMALLKKNGYKIVK